MASTRCPTPLKIFQDPNSNFDASTFFTGDNSNPHLSPSSPLDSMPSLPPAMSIFSRQPGSEASLIPVEGGMSPMKRSHPSSSSPARAPLMDRTNVSLPPPPPPLFTTDSPVKKSIQAPYHPIAPHQPRNLFGAFPGFGILEKEYLAATYHSENVAEFPAPDHESRVTGLTLAAVTPLEQDQCQGKKQPTEGIAPAYIPEPHDMPIVEDDGSKPPYSYASLIAMSILRAPSRRLTLAQIYKWITDTFSYYRTAETGWQNSIRHNLSLNKAFIKQERPKDDPGKGNYWMIEPGMEATFIKEKPSRRPAGPVRFQMQSGSDFRPSSSAGLAGPRSEASLAAPSPLPQDSGLVGSESLPQQLPPPVPQSALQDAPAELSSDATIPASDPALLEEDSMPPPASRARLSSPPNAIRSSPPVPDRTASCQGTPFLGFDVLSSRSSHPKKRKYHSMNDSGYFSSLDSSAMRPLTAAGNERDSAAPRFKRGRAEEEIARIRSSSHDISPSKGRTQLKQPPTNALSSSPLRAGDSSLNLLNVGNPITPSILFKKPRRPPPSISPNTNLRNHRNRIRELIGSPIRAFDYDLNAFSPAFQIAEDDFFCQDTGFGIYHDSPIKRKADASPEKRSVKRPRFDRAQSTASALADITGTSNSIKKLNPTLKPPFLGSPLRAGSPVKSPSKLNTVNGVSDIGGNDFLNLDLLVDEEPDELGGLDLLAGFQKIGEKENEVPSIKAKTSRNRPPLGNRSLTSQF
ncbi:MAG: hypothetical protein LQ340_004084 [Diploschistes diacapsis]|nr:MAG: hypothetical protein LQ340_004084 [Diploschistes diacapsis]